MLEGFEYTFFDRLIAEKFVTYLQEKQIQCRIDEEEVISGDFTFTVFIESELQDTAIETIESHYDDLLFGEQASLIEGNTQQGALADVCGIQLQLSSGEFTTVAIQPEIMNKLLSVLSIEEIQSFMSQVAEDIEHPKSGPICSRSCAPSE